MINGLNISNKTARWQAFDRDSNMAKPKRREADELVAPTELRIIGGRFRGRRLKYEPFRSGDEPVTRPMKHRVREAIFNLVSTESQGRHAIDLFAGTGALGLEALSRGAVHATFIERHVPTARVIEENIKSLGVDDQATLLTTSAFLWGKRDLPHFPTERAGSSPSPAWLIFSSPPYAFYVEREEEMLELLNDIMKLAPAGSVLVVEADERFSFPLLEGDWIVRTYLPAVVGVWRKTSATLEDSAQRRRDAEDGGE
jgi:16S rRNA (guanine966-N2)-methyltransferase